MSADLERPIENLLVRLVAAMPHTVTEAIVAKGGSLVRAREEVPEPRDRGSDSTAELAARTRGSSHQPSTAPSLICTLARWDFHMGEQCEIKQREGKV